MTFSSNMARHNASPSETHESQVDFTQAIWKALRHAPIFHRDANAPASQDVDEWATLFADAADSKMIRVSHVKRPNTVTSTTPASYRGLLRQTCDILWPYPRVPQQQIEEWVEHESEHGEACLNVNPEAEVFYGAQLNWIQETSGDMNWSILPFVGIDGFLRKIDVAFVAVAPTRLSHSDLHIAHALGYESTEDILERHGNLSAQHP